MASTTRSSSNIVGGWACLVLQDWDQRVTHEKLPQGLAPPLKVRRGEQAWVFNRIGDYGFVHAHHEETHKRGKSFHCASYIPPSWLAMEHF